MSSLFEQLKEHIPQAILDLPTPALVLLGVVGIPALIIALNVFRQVCLPRDKTLPPVVFHYIPWFGSAAYYGEDPYKFFFECREKYGDLFSFILLGRKITVALGPKGNNLSLGGKVSQVSAEEAYTHLTTPVFGKGVVYDCPNDMLMQQKKFIKTGLTTESLQSYPPLIDSECEDFFNHELKISASNPTAKVDILHTMSELIILTASRTLQGKEVRESLNGKFAKYYEDLDGGFTPLNFMFPNLPLPSYKRRDKAQKAMSDFYMSIIQDRKKGETDHENDMIASLQGCVYKNGVPLSDRDISHIMIALLMAGQHTSSATSSWTLLHLADRPDIYEQLYQEQKAKFGNEDGIFRPMTYEAVKELPLMDAVIRETLRMHAPIHSIYRKVLSDIPVPPSLSAPSEGSSYIIPKGHFICAAPGVSQMDPLIWQDAKTWNPNRWLEEKGVGQAAVEQYTKSEQVDYGFGSVSKGTESPYQPFGAGRHRCVGEQFAYTQLSTIFAYIVRHFTLSLDADKVPEPNYRVSRNGPKGLGRFSSRIV
ncbi:cytochrome P450, family 51 (sterol 14-demethylase) [Kwoniella heveanensis BCC8398]|uniref:Cytochrome P450, family 51 (Sterol 14-demethylase) n=1 Tax=Kwoniella heveanensis BCC8398 TaxID=1296120 RepID=A0A1B9H127_9TREE|nr:cytochrome P450, family 51 (sterol 14-demethylase) [Kwoniella heveanensis BCC8398]